MGNLAVVVAYRRKMQIVPEKTAILSIIAHYRMAFSLFPHRPLHFMHSGLIVISPKEVAISPNHVVDGIAGNAFEGWINIFDRILSMDNLGDDNRVDTGFNGAIA